MKERWSGEWSGVGVRQESSSGEENGGGLEMAVVVLSR